MSLSLFRRWSVLVFALSQFVVSQVYFVGDFDEATVQPPLELPDLLVQPASYAFSIWFVIYLGCLGYALYQLRPKYRDHPDFEIIAVWSALGTTVFFIKWFRGHWGYDATIAWALVGVLVANGFALLGWLAILGMVVVGLATLK